MKRFFRMVVGLGLGGLLASAQVQAGTVVLGGSGSTLAMMQLLGAAYAKVEPGFQLRVLPSLGSGGAIKGLVAGSIDVGSIARELKPEEVAKGLQGDVLAHSPVVLATSRTSERNITTQQLEKIYGGQQTHWSDNSSIRLVLRPASETDTELISGLSAGMKKAVNAALSKDGMLVTVTDQDAAAALEKQPGSLGTSTLALIRAEKRALTVLELDGVAAEINGRVNGRYPLKKPLVLVLRSDARAEVVGFVRFVKSEQAKALLATHGYLHASERH